EAPRASVDARRQAPNPGVVPGEARAPRENMPARAALRQSSACSRRGSRVHEHLPVLEPQERLTGVAQHDQAVAAVDGEPDGEVGTVETNRERRGEAGRKW